MPLPPLAPFTVSEDVAAGFLFLASNEFTAIPAGLITHLSGGSHL